jgi:phosphodiesterase/alkaline phosphatase D-like protein
VGVLAALVALAAMAMLVAGGSAAAATLHPTENYGFGPDGTSATNFKVEYGGKVRAPVFDQEHHRLLTFGVAGCCGPSSMYAWSYNGPGSFTPLPGFPISASEVAFSTVQLAIDESGGPADGTIYKATSGTTLVALNPDGTSKQGVTFEPEEGGYKAGAVAVGPEGHVFSANNGGKQQVEEFAPTGGTPLRIIPLSPYTNEEISGLAIDQQTGDLYVRVYNKTVRLTKEANYEDAAPLIIGTPQSGNLVVDSSARVLYAAAYHQWGAYDLETGSILEEREGAGVSYETTVDGLAVDEATHTVFTGNSAENHWQVEEWRPVSIASVTTGPPTGNKTLSGTVDPAGGGNVSECKFEYLPSSAFNGVQEVSVTGATGGTYELYNYAAGNYSEPIPYNATVAQFKTAVEAKWGAGSVSVTGSNGGPYTVENIGPLAGTGSPYTFSVLSSLTPEEGSSVNVVIKREGGPAAAWKTPLSVPCTPAGAISAPTGVSAEISGLASETTYHYRLVAVDANGKAIGAERTITPHRVTALMTEAADGITRTAAELHGSYVGSGEADHWWFEWGTSPSALTSSSPEEPQTATGHTAISTAAEGLLPNKVYYFRVSAKNAASEVSHGDILHFKTLPPVQSLQTKPATEVKPHTAKLNGSFVGDGTETEYFYEWGTTEHYGHTTPVEKTTASGPTALEPFKLTGLTLETTYHYRVVAKNALGTSRGADTSFKTLPAVAGLEVKPVTELESHSATLQGVFTGNGDPTHYHFKWGPSTAYGNNTPTMESSATGVSQLTPAHLEGLTPEVTYHVQIVATNSEGETKSADFTFTTPPAVRGLKTLPATEIGQEEIQLNGEFAGNGQHTTYWFEYGTSTAYDHKVPATPLDAGSPTGPEPISTTISDYVAYTTYHYRVVAVNDEGETKANDETFETLGAELPNIRNEQASEVGTTSATLGAEIDPMRWKTVYLFEYGTTTAYGEATELDPEPIGEDHVFHEVTEDIGGLAPATVYHFRVVAINYTGTRFGPDQTFATPGAPTIDLASASAITASSAHLAGLVNPNSTDTTVHFEYGSTETYGSSTGSVAIGKGRVDRDAAADITGLHPNTIYHYRVVATNQYGTVSSRDQTFTTAQGAPPRPEERLVCKRPKVKRHGRCVRRHHHHKKTKKHHHRNSNHRNG